MWLASRSRIDHYQHRRRPTQALPQPPLPPSFPKLATTLTSRTTVLGVETSRKWNYVYVRTWAGPWGYIFTPGFFCSTSLCCLYLIHFRAESLLYSNDYITSGQFYHKQTFALFPVGLWWEMLPCTFPCVCLSVYMCTHFCWVSAGNELLGHAHSWCAYLIFTAPAKPISKWCT